MKARSRIKHILTTTLATALLLAVPVQAHHSFAMYDLKITKVFTGVVTRVDPAPNHLAIFFAPMNAERTNVERDANGEPLAWTVEMGGSAQMARQGITVNAFPRGAIFSVGLHPLRSGNNAGSREGGLFKCPDKKPPEPGKHCDSVEGHTALGNAPLPEPTE
ncbi:MAG: hypothetical protein HW386_1425 [Gammaproteobacteria bacterium]|nr:hypothetical protein [Gammaproteobacteria bacterium]